VTHGTRSLGAGLVAALLALVGCGDSGPSPGGRTLNETAVKRCLKSKGLTVQGHQTESGIDFSAYWRDGRNSADIGVASTPGAAADLEESWKKLAQQAHVQNIDAYYFRHGNIVVGYERVPNATEKARVASCLTA
jgi:predicted ABC-class ATPase